MMLAPIDDLDSSPDEPPPLDDMSEFVLAKLRSAKDHLPVGRTLASSRQKKTDAFTLKGVFGPATHVKEHAAELPFRKGFLNPICQQKKRGKDTDNIPFLKANNDRRASNIPGPRCSIVIKC